MVHRAEMEKILSLIATLGGWKEELNCLQKSLGERKTKQSYDKYLVGEITSQDAMKA